MTTYLDQAFWENINIAMCDCKEELEQETWLNFVKFLKSESDVFLNIPLESLQGLSNIYNTLTTGRGKTSKLLPKPDEFRKLMNGPLLFQNYFDKPDFLFLLEPSENERLNKWREKNGFLIADHSGFLQSWMIYRQMDTSRYPRSFSVRKNPKYDDFNLKSFDGLAIYKHPVTDVVLADQYIFKEKELLTYNLSRLFESIIEVRPNINFSIFGSINNTFEKDPEYLRQIIVALLSKYGDIKIEVILNNHGLLKEHDRHLITNYFHFKPGDSFTLFKPNKELKTNGTTIDIKTLFDSADMKTAINTLENLHKIKTACDSKSKPLKLNRLFNLISR